MSNVGQTKLGILLYGENQYFSITFVLHIINHSFHINILFEKPINHKEQFKSF